MKISHTCLYISKLHVDKTTEECVIFQVLLILQALSSADTPEQRTINQCSRTSTAERAYSHPLCFTH